jgi:hypothetical protein
MKESLTNNKYLKILDLSRNFFSLNMSVNGNLTKVGYSIINEILQKSKIEKINLNCINYFN